MRAPSSVSGYFTAIDAADATAAAACFADDAEVAVPPADGDEAGERVVRRGRSHLERAFSARGVPTWRHSLTHAVGAGREWFIAGSLHPVDGDEVLSRFLVFLRLDLSGRITQFRSFRRTGDARGPFPVEQIDGWSRLAASALTGNRVASRPRLASTAPMSLPAQCPATGVPQLGEVEVTVLHDDHVGVYGCSGLVEFALLARCGADHRIEELIAYWCSSPSRAEQRTEHT